MVLTAWSTGNTPPSQKHAIPFAKYNLGQMDGAEYLIIVSLLIDIDKYIYIEDRENIRDEGEFHPKKSSTMKVSTTT